MLTREQVLALPAGWETDALVDALVMGGPPACLESPRRPYTTEIAAAFEVEAAIARRNLEEPYVAAMVALVTDRPCVCTADMGICWMCWFSAFHASPLHRCKAALLATLKEAA